MQEIALLIPIFAILGTFVSISLFIYVYFTSRHKQRMALLEYGKDASVFNRHKENTPRPFAALKAGLVLVAIGVGILIAYFLTQLGLPEYVAFLSMIPMFSGLGMLFFYRIAKNKQLEYEL